MWIEWRRLGANLALSARGKHGKTLAIENQYPYINVNVKVSIMGQ
jgi:hypothetical protein